MHVALTYEPEDEDISVREGWAQRICRTFNDHFILAGPGDVDLHAESIADAFRAIAMSQRDGEQQKYLFHSRGDGSATFNKEQRLWELAEIYQVERAEWIATFPSVPYDALVHGEKEGAFLLTDRSLYLTAKRDGVIPSLKVHVEGGEELASPCSAMVASSELNARLETSEESHTAARSFAEWLAGDRAQEFIEQYGLEWPLDKPLFTVGSRDGFGHHDCLVGQC